MSLENVLKPEYGLVLQVNAATTINQFCDEFLDDNKHTARFKRKWGERFVGEITPKLLKAQSIWNTPVSPEKLSPQLLYALEDKKFHAVLHKAEPDYPIDLKNITAGLIARNLILQHLGMANRLAHRKKAEIAAFVKTLNDENAYQTVKNRVKKELPGFEQYLPTKPFRFKLMPYDKNMVKELDSAYRKIDDNQPSKDNPNKAGVLSTNKDPLRITIALAGKLCDNPTWEMWTQARNQVFATLIMDPLFHIQNTKDHVSRAALTSGQTLHWPACMFHGKQYYPLEENGNVHVGLSQEIQFSPLSEKNEYYKETTVAVRKYARQSKQKGIKDGTPEAQAAMTKQMHQKTLPNLLNAIQSGRSDPAYTLMLEYVSEKNNVTANNLPDTLIDLSGSTSLQNIGHKPRTRKALQKMIQPYPRLRR